MGTVHSLENLKSSGAKYDRLVIEKSCRPTPCFSLVLCNRFCAQLDVKLSLYFQAASDDWKSAKSVYEFTVNDIGGNPVSLEKYRGNVLLIVNVASQCGLTATNYKELQELHEKFNDKVYTDFCCWGVRSLMEW